MLVRCVMRSRSALMHSSELDFQKLIDKAQYSRLFQNPPLKVVFLRQRIIYEV